MNKFDFLKISYYRIDLSYVNFIYSFFRIHFKNLSIYFFIFYDSWQFSCINEVLFYNRKETIIRKGTFFLSCYITLYCFIKNTHAFKNNLLPYIQNNNCNTNYNNQILGLLRVFEKKFYSYYLFKSNIFYVFNCFTRK